MVTSRMPPFAALRAFHAAATHDRYKDAADSLGITDSAVSHQVRKLEAFLHTDLFDRTGGGARLTETGRRYLEQIDPAFRQIQAATEAILPSGGRHAVRLTLPPSIAATWVIPRLRRLEEDLPDIDLQLIPTTRVVDLKRDQIDLAIRHGRGRWTGVEADFLFEETTMPVCAPGYLPDDIADPDGALAAGARLIVNGGFPDEWTEWTAANGLPAPSLEGAITLQETEQVLQVAESGHGLAMGRRPVVDDRLSRGTLVAPFGGPNPTGAAYYLCRAADLTPTAAARRLGRWLQKMAAGWRAEAAGPDR